jgi:hypothetical protein
LSELNPALIAFSSSLAMPTFFERSSRQEYLPFSASSSVFCLGLAQFSSARCFRYERTEFAPWSSGECRANPPAFEAVGALNRTSHQRFLVRTDQTLNRRAVSHLRLRFRLSEPRPSRRCERRDCEQDEGGKRFSDNHCDMDQFADGFSDPVADVKVTNNIRESLR